MVNISWAGRGGRGETGQCLSGTPSVGGNTHVKVRLLKNVSICRENHETLVGWVGGGGPKCYFPL